jgi:hypothetical protein
MSKLTVNEEVNRIRQIMGINEGYDMDHVDDISAAKSSAKGQQNFNQDAIDYVGGEEEWNKLSPAEKDSVLSDIEKDWDRSRSMGEADETDLSQADNPNAYTDDKDQEEWDRDSGFDDGNDFMRISIPIMSALSDIQESNPELRNKINFIKALIQKSKIDDQYIDDSELNDLEKKFNTQSY